MPITTAHGVPPLPNPHRAHSLELGDPRGAGVLAKLPRVALPRSNYIAPALALCVAVAGGGLMATEAACGFASPPVRRVELVPATHMVGAGDMLPTAKVRRIGLLSVRRRHAEIREATRATVAEVA
ncbi:hypothetical protein AB0F91_22305 [Amycolatopsis sp. NPDC023774]|uniref:hypothetical protein n=1 Tax=Amycolatopsis sp. NPDC023774 TaxID=3155015 RepID=UPI00340C42F9